MDEVRTTTIQHINDATLYYDYWTGIWIDSSLLLPAADPNAPVETVTVEFGTPFNDNPVRVVDALQFTLSQSVQGTSIRPNNVG